VNWSFRLGTILGIPIRVHFTFLILLALFSFSEASRSGARAGLGSLVFMVLLFSCVLLHELGHCVVARRFGVSITSITLYPFGGIAFLTDIPREPAREILIAIAGPVVNFLIAAGLFVGVVFLTPDHTLQISALTDADLLRSLFSVNLLLGLFNLVPAYPMDGGRILRGVLATRMPYAAATHWAARIGKVFGGIFVLTGILMQDWWLPILGVFLYIGANSEEQATLLQSAMEGLTVNDLMITEYLTLSPAETLSEVLRRSLHTFQEDFPVLRDGTFFGVLSRGRMLEALREEEGDQFVQSVAQPVNGWVSPADPLREALRRMQAERVGLLPVLDQGRMVGIVTLGGVLRGAALLSGRAPVP
jgi:Zn-dependent protease/CBS domain-containing protein